MTCINMTDHTRPPSEGVTALPAASFSFSLTLKELTPMKGAICKSTKPPPEGEIFGLNGINFNNQNDQAWLAQLVTEQCS